MSSSRNFSCGRRRFRGLLLPLLRGAFLGIRAQSAVPTAKWMAGDRKGISVEGVEPVGPPSAGNAALFMGVNEFEDQSLRALRFAVNDAVAQAHLFVLELKLIPPANTVVMLSGEPSTDTARRQLTALKDAGVRVDRASRAKMLNELARAVAMPQETTDLVVVSLRSHGFEESGIPYVMPADGTRAFLADTGFKLKTVEDRLARSKAGKRLLIVDACREKATGDDKSLGTSMDRAWREALAQASGQAVLASCDVGQFSFEDVKLGHGVFTYYLLAALNGKATPDTRGHITLGAVSDHVARSVNEWVLRNKVGSAAESALYRLPTDEEWSWAVGIGDKEEKGTPAEKAGRLKSVFPWGTQWPPPNGTGNYTDSDAKAKFGTGLFGALTGVIAGYTDGYPTTAPVGSFPPNALGIFDLGGNVSEWCEEWHAGRLTFRVCRGGSWMSNDPMFINASSRFNFPKDLDSDDIGFRIVLQGLSR